MGFFHPRQSRRCNRHRTGRNSSCIGGASWYNPPNDDHQPTFAFVAGDFQTRSPAHRKRQFLLVFSTAPALEFEKFLARSEYALSIARHQSHPRQERSASTARPLWVFRRSLMFRRASRTEYTHGQNDEQSRPRHGGICPRSPKCPAITAAWHTTPGRKSSGIIAAPPRSREDMSDPTIRLQQPAGLHRQEQTRLRSSGR